MIDDIPTHTKLRIETSISKAVELYPLIHGDSELYGGRNQFLDGMRIYFHRPQHNKASLQYFTPVPKQVWFCLFDETEKEIMQDEYAFYGIGYETTVKLAIKRVKKIIDDFEEEISEKRTGRQEGKRNLYRRDDLKEIAGALTRLHEDDKIRLEFVFPEWPSLEEARKKDYSKIAVEDLLKISEKGDPLDALNL